ncbi:MAG TPA: hypothetical protein VK961_17830 [Chthoniobacter sp.]|nr:hypothetical protein [Chthoniobacter sp.]
MNSSSTSAEGHGASASLKRSLRDRSAGAGTGIDVGAGGAATTNVTVAAAVPITRTGKIARLPQAIRQRLNERLADGEPQQLLVAWLNEHEIVRERLERFHGGRPITEQNLSDWKAGGFRDWERHQETRGMLREFLHETEELSAELAGEELLEKATNSVALALLQLLRDAMAGHPKLEERQAVLQIARELDRMRRVSHEGQRVQLLVEKAHEPSDEPRKDRVDWKELQREVAEDVKEQKQEDAWLRVEAEMLRAEYVTGMETQTLTPERREYIEGFFDYYQSSVEALHLEPLPRWQEPNAQVVKRKAAGKKKPAAQPEPSGELATDEHGCKNPW